MNTRRNLPWSKRCPKGHSSLRVCITKPKYECKTCGIYYAGSPFDIRDVGSFPMPPSTYEVVGQRGGGEA